MQSMGDGPRWMLRLASGEELLESLGAFAQAHGIRAAAIGMGIGQLTQATLGYWNGEEYEKQEIREAVELVALGGSIAEAEGRPSVHLHATVGHRDHSTTSGHVLNGTVGLLAEIFVEDFPGRRFGRPMDESRGLRILDLEPGPSSP